MFAHGHHPVNDSRWEFLLIFGSAVQLQISAVRKTSIRLARTIQLVVGIVVLQNVAASGQTREVTLTAGFAAPFDHHHIGDETASSPNIIRPAVWAELAIPLNSPRLTFHTGIEFPVIPFNMVFIHQGSRGYRDDIQHREFVLSQLFGVRFGAERTHAILFAGPAIVVDRRVDNLTIPGGFLRDGTRGPTERRKEIDTNAHVAIAGGLDVPIAIKGRIAITPRVRLRTAFAAGYRPYSKFAVSTGVGVRYRF